MASENKKLPPVGIKNLLISVNDQVRNGVYSNIVNMSTTSNGEVILDFIFNHPNDKGENDVAMGQVVSRVIIPLEVAKSLKLVMDAQLGKSIKE